MSIESAIKDAQEAIFEHRSIYLSNEQAVRDTLINPILNELGWNTKSLKFVVPNAPNEDGKIPDYVLLKNHKKVLVVEAKNMSIDLSDSQIIKQIASYCYNPGIKFGVLTNGEKWLLFNTFQANPSERIVWKLDLIKDEIQQAIRKLLCITYEVIEQTEQLSSTIRKDELLEDAWKNMVQGKESITAIFCESIQQKIKFEYPSVLLNPDHVRSFITDKLKEFFHIATNKDVHTTKNKIIEEGSNDKSNRSDSSFDIEKGAENTKIKGHKSRHIKSKLRIKIRVTFPDKISIFHEKVVDTFVEVIEKIGPENIKNLGIIQNGIAMISDQKDSIYGKAQKLIPPNFYIMTHSSTKEKIRQLHEINERLNLGIKIEEIIPSADT